MKLFWHIGPHKTGSTTLQEALAAHVASGRASFYYPTPAAHGPGHAVLAWKLLGLNGVETDPEALRTEIRRAEDRGFSKVVISSEEFSRGLLAAEPFAPLAAICDVIECELMITLRPLTERVYPEAQEQVKNGGRIWFANPQELLALCADRPGLRADFLPAAINGTRAASVSVIFVDPAVPQKLLESVSVVLDERIEAEAVSLLSSARKVRANVSYPFIKTAWLEAVNRFSKLPAPEARKAVDAAFNAASREVEGLVDIGYPALPPILERYLGSVWEFQLAYLHALEESGRVRIL